MINLNNTCSININQQTKICYLPDIPVEVWYKNNKIIILELLNFVKDIKGALGLSANQASYNNKIISERFFLKRIDGNINKNFEVVLFPKILNTYGNKYVKLEGCLTWPGRTIVAERFLRIDVSYYSIDSSGEIVKIEKELTSLEAQIWQHEMDHLNGVEETFHNGEPIKVRFKEPGRNDLCSCGSSKKYKKCCGK